MDAVAVGLGVREVWYDALLGTERGALDMLEVMIDDVLTPGERRARWRRLGSRWPLVAHGVDLGVGDADGVAPEYVERVGEATRDLRCRWYSEHLAFVRAGGIDLGHFGPVFDDDDTRAALRRNAALVRERVPAPFLLENPADILGWQSGASLGSAYRRALEAAECGALLDLTNLVYNARNDGWPVEAFLEELPWDRVVQIHLAGGRQVGDLWIDSHDRPVDADARALVGEVARRAPQLRAVTIEWDEDVPSLDTALAEVEQVRAVLARAGRR